MPPLGNIRRSARSTDVSAHEGNWGDEDKHLIE
jgi:hypothetical protein